MKRGLGKGLDALFADNAAEEDVTPVKLRLSEIEPNSGQPRRAFNEEALSQLADSIRAHGVLQPLVVRPIPGTGTYQLVAGERRWRAARMAGLTDVPVIIREMDDAAVMEVALIENLQREDLNPMEEAQGFSTLMESYGLTQDEVAERVGKSRPAVANTLRLLGLPEEVRGMVSGKKLSQGHARALLGLEKPETMCAFARLTVQKGLSVRELERLVKRQGKERSARPAPGLPSVFALEAERSLSDYFGRKVSVSEKKGKGTLSLEYTDEDDLHELVKRLVKE